MAYTPPIYTELTSQKLDDFTITDTRHNPSDPFMVVDLETLNVVTSSENVFHAAIGLCNDDIQTPEHAQFVRDQIRECYFKPDENAFDQDTILFHEKNGCYHTDQVMGVDDNPNRLEAKDFIPWLRENYMDLLRVFNLEDMRDKIAVYMKYPAFDNAIIQHYAHANAQKTPWPHYTVRDMVTFTETARMLNPGLFNVTDNERIYREADQLFSGDSVVTILSHPELPKHHAVADVGVQLNRLMDVKRSLSLYRRQIHAHAISESADSLVESVYRDAHMRKEALEFLEHHDMEKQATTEERSAQLN